MAITILQQIVAKIIKEQELIIGPVALSVAQKVPGLVINKETKDFSFEGEPKVIIDNLVARYEELFGRASHEVCREAVGSLIIELSATEVPVSLR